MQVPFTRTDWERLPVFTLDVDELFAPARTS
jgi:hypothetical protein